MFTFLAWSITALISGSIGALIMAVVATGKISRLEEERDLLDAELTVYMRKPLAEEGRHHIVSGRRHSSRHPGTIV